MRRKIFRQMQPKPQAILCVINYSVPPESHNNLVVFQRFYAEY